MDASNAGAIIGELEALALSNGGAIIGGLVVAILALVIFLVPIWKIIRKAGYSGWWILLYLVPLVNIIMLWVFAFARWPNLATAKRAHPPDLSDLVPPTPFDAR